MKHIASHTAPTGAGYPPYINFALDEDTNEVRICGREGPTSDGREGRPFELRIDRCSAETLFEEGSSSLGGITSAPREQHLQISVDASVLKGVIEAMQRYVDGELVRLDRRGRLERR